MKDKYILAHNSRHFNNSMGNIRSDDTLNFSFFRAWIWYEIACSITYTLSPKRSGVVMRHSVFLIFTFFSRARSINI